MQHQSWLAVVIATNLPVDELPVADVQHAVVIRIYLWVKS